MSEWETIPGNLATPRGFRGAAVAAGIKKTPGAPDLALIFSDSPNTAAAGVFTTNRAAAAPVLVSQEHLRRSHGHARAIVVNSGNANCSTGRAGLRAARDTARVAASLLGLRPHEVLVASTGIIGMPLRTELILNQLPRLQRNLSAEDATAVARALMTTDTFPKSCALRASIKGKLVHWAGIAKGAGMIHPRMATMLAFITSDAAVRPKDLAQFLRASVEVSFNRISVDGDTSTNDTVIVLASGQAGVVVRPKSRAGARFQVGLTELCQALAKMIVRDGEGAHKVITLEIRGARTPADAERLARSIANSPLVKTAIAGSDPNWGRILCAAGYSGAALDPHRIDIFVNGLALCRSGLDTGFDQAAVKRELDRKEFILRLDLHQGKASTTFWTCDLTHDYIDLNASYRT